MFFVTSNGLVSWILDHKLDFVILIVSITIIKLIELSPKPLFYAVFGIIGLFIIVPVALYMADFRLLFPDGTRKHRKRWNPQKKRRPYQWQQVIETISVRWKCFSTHSFL